MAEYSKTIAINQLKTGQTFYWWSNHKESILLKIVPVFHGTYYVHYLTCFGKEMQKKIRNLDSKVYLNSVKTHLHKV